MSEAFRDISPDAPELQPIISGLFAEYAARYGDYFSRDAEVELSECCFLHSVILFSYFWN